MLSTLHRAALITGAARNIGRAIALTLARDGHDVVINGSTDQAAAERVADEARALGAMGDVGSPADCRRIADAALAEFGTVDVLVNNEALRPARPFLDSTPEDWRRVLAVDLEAAIWLSQALLPGMVAKGCPPT